MTGHIHLCFDGRDEYQKMFDALTGIEWNCNFLGMPNTPVSIAVEYDSVNLVITIPIGVGPFAEPCRANEPAIMLGKVVSNDGI